MIRAAVDPSAAGNVARRQQETAEQGFAEFLRLSHSAPAGRGPISGRITTKDEDMDGTTLSSDVSTIVLSARPALEPSLDNNQCVK